MLSTHFQNRNVLVRWSSGVSYPTGLSMQIAQLRLHSLRRYSGCQGDTTLRGYIVCDNEIWSQRPRLNDSSEEGNEEPTFRNVIERHALINCCWQNEYQKTWVLSFQFGQIELLLIKIRKVCVCVPVPPRGMSSELQQCFYFCICFFGRDKARLCYKTYQS